MDDARMPLPAEPLTALVEAAAQLHELFTAFRTAGFSEEQAYGLAVVTLTETIRKQP